MYVQYVETLLHLTKIILIKLEYYIESIVVQVVQQNQKKEMTNTNTHVY